ncbi:MAG: hypothetical protein PF961_05600, partial [Planctomycetota bacterium]|jgi:prepilin-type processing-associated H-X9-DG protein|nr:hypothetical protein [Planctomycetota bacterium]
MWGADPGKNNEAKRGTIVQPIWNRPPMSFETGTIIPPNGWHAPFVNNPGGGSLKVCHRGRSNYLFFDCHVETLKPAQTTGPDISFYSNKGPPDMWTGQ